MQIYHTLQIGEFHTNHCEDFLIIEDISDSEKLLAVFDGCSSGKESVFASILFGKILRNISKQEFHKSFIVKEKSSMQEKMKAVLLQFFNKLKLTKQTLDLDTYELLSTVIICLTNTENKTAEIVVAGDGLVTVDGKQYDFESNDKPNYLAYHLQKSFEDWFTNETQKITINHYKDLSLATDGIFAFKNLKNRTNEKSESEIIEFLMNESVNTTLDAKIKTLNQQYDHLPTDDIAIIRVQN
ncbi:protein phosphatase 2C domain-containing protein [uncultured Tenacibaculum sp.]|uniref:protein phosphatase 2C domain-containing protein n=1 Tax=uncultured Tenacibaculum sp. TaxID=174713 RepID=UPI0026024552|nr:protein phosphatase 2C domain-containing protein [uncultured Tenacibaculum sp.]